MANPIPFPNGGLPPKREGRIDFLIAQLHMILPAKSLKEIQEGYTRKGIAVSIPMIGQLLTHLRRYAAIYNWTVPHVKRGRVRPEGCYFAVHKEKDGFFTTDAEKRAFTQDGLRGLVRTIATSSKSEAAALEMYAQYERRPQREAITELVVDCQYIARKARGVLRQMNG
jgi:hypothetical protein